MRRCALLLTLLLASPALAGDDMIGLYADEYAETCSADFGAMASTRLYVIATLDDIDAIISAEFRIEGLPPSSGGIITKTWSSLLTIGDLDDNFAIAFSEAQSGSYVVLGTLDFLPFTDTWFGQDHELRIEPGSLNPQDEVVLVDSGAETIGVRGGRFTANCGDPSGCGCGPGGVADAHWSGVKQNY